MAASAYFEKIFRGFLMNIDSGASPYGLPRLFRFVFAIAGILGGFIACRLVLAGFTVSDNSMNPNYGPGDRVYAVKIGAPSVGDAVLVNSPIEPGKYLLKRVVAAEGDVVELRNRVLYINNERARFHWKVHSVDNRTFPMSFSGRDTMTAVKMERHHYFLLGDNLDYSLDSREFGPVRENDVIGRVVYHR
ncbi:MAG: Signal peptidase I V [Spirochaetes bacterium ADurb.BinA120]|nr:MAG: Signal peptidase I V [Spirochaetes bacterium ADurb.BinA120]